MTAPYHVEHKHKDHEQEYYTHVWTIIGPDGNEIDSTSGGDGSFANDICSKLNEAYARGAESSNNDPANRKSYDAFSQRITTLQSQLKALRQRNREAINMAIRLGAWWTKDGVLVARTDPVYYKSLYSNDVIESTAEKIEPTARMSYSSSKDVALEKSS